MTKHIYGGRGSKSGRGGEDENLYAACQSEKLFLLSVLELTCQYKYLQMAHRAIITVSMDITPQMVQMDIGGFALQIVRIVALLMSMIKAGYITML